MFSQQDPSQANPMFGGFIFYDFAICMVGFITGSFFAFTFVTAAASDQINLSIIFFCSLGLCVVLMGSEKMSSLSYIGQGFKVFERLYDLYPIRLLS